MNKNIAAFLAIFLGGLGIHKFYLGKGVAGIIFLLFSWTLIPMIIGFVEGLQLLVMSEYDFNQKYNNTNSNYPNDEHSSSASNFQQSKIIDSELAEDDKVRVCSNCGAKNAKVNKFCEYCGFKF